MSRYYYKFDYTVLSENEPVEKGAFFAQSPFVVSKEDMLLEARNWIGENDIVIDNIQEIKTKEEFISLGGSDDVIMSRAK